MFSFILLATGATIVMIDTKVFCNMPQNSKVEVSNKMIIVSLLLIHGTRHSFRNFILNNLL